MTRVAWLTLSLAACGAPVAPSVAAPPAPAQTSATPPASATPAPIASAAPVEEEPRLPDGFDVDGAALPDGAVARFGSERFRAANDRARVLFDAAGTALVVDHHDGVVELREVVSGAVRRARPSAKMGAVSPDAEVLITSQLELVGVKDGVVRRTLALPRRREVDRKGKAREVVPIVRAIFASDGARVVVVETNESVLVFDGAGGALKHTLKLQPPSGKRAGVALLFGPSLRVLSLARSGATLLTEESGGELAAVSLFGGPMPTPTATAWDLATGAAARRAPTKGDLERWLAVSPDGAALLLSRAERTLLIDVRTGKERAALDERDAPTSGSFSADGKVVALTRVRSITLRDLAGGELRSFERRASSVGLSSDGAKLATLTGHALAVGETRGAFDDGPPSHEDAARDLAVAPDGRLLATLAPEGLRFWDARTGKHLGLAPLGDGGHLAFSPSGDGLWLAHGEHLVFANLGARAPLREVAKARSPITALAVSPRGDWVAFARASTTPDRVAMVDVSSRALTMLEVPFADPDATWREGVRAIVPSSAGAYLVVATPTAAQVFRAGDHKLVQTVRSTGEHAWEDALPLSGGRVWLAGREHFAMALPSGELTPLQLPTCVRRASDPASDRVACANGRQLRIVDAATGAVLLDRVLPTEVRAAPRFMPGGAKVLTFHRNGVGLAWTVPVKAGASPTR